MKESDEIRRVNLEIAAKFSKIEAEFLRQTTIAGFLETFFAGIEKEFSVPFVWLTAIDSEAAAPLIKAAQSSATLKHKLNVVSPFLFKQILPKGIQPVLANKDLLPYYKLLPAVNKYLVKSLAIVPFRAGEEIVGSWNNGDVRSDRFLPEMETDLLQKIAGKVSSRLEELIALGK